MAASSLSAVAQSSRLLQFLLLATGGLLIYKLVDYALQSRRPSKFPPGPPTLPVIGNLHLLSQTKAFLQYSQLLHQYVEWMS
jgi:hypothetical protein